LGDLGEAREQQKSIRTVVIVALRAERCGSRKRQ
jgi:hypothetical protein